MEKIVTQCDTNKKGERNERLGTTMLHRKPSGLIIEAEQIKKAEHAISLALKMVLEDEAQTYEVIQYVLDKYIERLKSKKISLL